MDLSYDFIAQLVYHLPITAIDGDGIQSASLAGR